MKDRKDAKTPVPPEDRQEAKAPAPTENHKDAKSELDELRAKAAKADEYLDLARRAKADFINYQDRVRKDREALAKYGIEGFVREILPAIDSLEQSLRTLEKTGEAKTVLDGVRIIEKEFLRVLSNNGIRPIDAEGKLFDPLYHEALSVEESAQHAENLVLEVVRRGWMIHDRVLRPASVRVARRPAGPIQEIPDGQGSEEPPAQAQGGAAEQRA